LNIEPPVNKTRTSNHTPAVQAAQKAGVGFIAYTSISNASNNPLSLAGVHRTTEQAIHASTVNKNVQVNDPMEGRQACNV